MFNRVFPIKSIEHLNKLYFVVTVDIGKAAIDIKAGQFFQLKRPELVYPILRKPISIYDIQGSVISLMIKRLGKGTEQFSQMHAGDNLDILGPLGNGFPLVDNQKAVLVSGGIGYPPLYYLKKQLLELKSEVYWLHGGQSKNDIFPADEIWTDDGSMGNAGYVTEGLKTLLELKKPDVIYACGPKAMLKACNDLAQEYEVMLYVSLEEYMACGIGVCHGCAVPVKPSKKESYTYKNVCKDGPVFNANDIVWESM